MKVKYTAPVVIKLRVAQAIYAHQMNLIKQYDNKEISYEEMKRKEFPTDAIEVIEAAVMKAVDLNGVTAVADGKKVINAYPCNQKAEAVNESE